MSWYVLKFKLIKLLDSLLYVSLTMTLSFGTYPECHLIVMVPFMCSLWNGHTGPNATSWNGYFLHRSKKEEFTFHTMVRVLWFSLLPCTTWQYNYAVLFFAWFPTGACALLSFISLNSRIVLSIADRLSLTHPAASQTSVSGRTIPAQYHSIHA